MSRVLAADLGGSALKACIYDLENGAMVTATVPLSFDEAPNGHAEQDPRVWWDAFTRIVEELATQTGELADLAAITICGFTRTQVFLDGKGRVLRPALSFRDSRALGPAERALACPEIAKHPSARHLNAFHPLARLLWLKHNEAECWNATRVVIEPKDYLNLRLTGRVMSDHISQFWLDTAMRQGSPTLAALAGIERDLLPTIGAPEAVVGAVLPDLPGALSSLAGTPVFCGSNDTWTAVAGLGAMVPQKAYCISGSSEVFGLLSAREAEANGLITISWDDDLWQIGGPGQNGANVLKWIVDLLDPSELPLAEKLSSLVAHQSTRRPLIFHPYLHGERTPFWDRDLRACFLGLTANHGKGDMVRAVMEGVAFLNRLVLERAEQASGAPALEVKLAGGGARSRIWNQIRADVLGRPVSVSGVREMGLSGCLAVARLGLGIAPDLAAAAEMFSHNFERYEPDPAQVRIYNELYAIFCESFDVVSSVSRRLALVGRGQITTVSK